jgi:hypothetical protein
MKSTFSKAIGALLLLVFIGVDVAARQAQPKPASSPEELSRLMEQKEKELRDWETKIFQLRYADPITMRQVLAIFRAEIGGDRASRLLPIRAPKEIMPAIEDTIKRLDVPSPSKSAELTVYVLLASDRDQPEAGMAVPPSLQPVVNQLKNVLTYKMFRLVDTLLVRGTDGQNIMLSGVLPITGPSFPTHYSLNGRFHVEQADGNSRVLLRTMRFSIRTLVNEQWTELNISTDVEIPQGKQVVVGKTQFGDTAYILVMSSKFD